MHLHHTKCHNPTALNHGQHSGGLWGVICVKMTMTMHTLCIHMHIQYTCQNAYARYNIHVKMHMHITIYMQHA